MFGHLHRTQVFMETTNEGDYRGGFANGHLCNVDEALYISCPDWQQSFSTIDYCWEGGESPVFNVDQHLIVNGATVWGGKVFRGG